MALTRWVLLLRGVNVGGRNRLPMAELRAAPSGIGRSKLAAGAEAALGAPATARKASVLDRLLALAGGD